MALLARNDEVASAQPLEAEWARLCARYLPFTVPDSLWRYSRHQGPDDPEQGWKLHITSTILSANETLARVAPVLLRAGVMFKAPASLAELSNLNCGLFYGFSQIGKFITVYPRDDAEAVRLARKLDRLTSDLSGPAVPYDLPFRPGSCVYYRYGAFHSLSLKQPDGTLVPAVRDLRGEFVPDLRAPDAAVPAWAANPFPRHRKPTTTRSPLRTTFRAYEALSQRGRGGVYKAIDFGASRPRFCILKEGRRHGETAGDGRDGYWRVRHEGEVLLSLSAAGVDVPTVYDTFEAEDNYYLATEFIAGENLQAVLSTGRRRLPLALSLRHAVKLSRLMQSIHAAGWVWRDCKPLNLIVSKEGALHPLDFEGACRTDAVDEIPWGTVGYAAPEVSRAPTLGSRLPEDLYALGVTLYQLLSGRVDPPKTLLASNLKFGRKVPGPAREITSALLARDPGARPDARTVAATLESLCPVP